MSKLSLKILLIILAIFFNSFSIVNYAEEISPEDLISRYYESKKDLKTYKLIMENFLKETVVPKSETKSNIGKPKITEIKFNLEGFVDIENRKMQLTMKKTTVFPEFPKMPDDIEGLSDVSEEYVIDNFYYSEHKFYVEGKLKESKWCKSASAANAMWKVADIFSIFKGFRGLDAYGLKLKEISEENFDGESCYCINYMISDLEKFKKFASPQEGVIFTKEFTGIEKDVWEIKSFSLKACIAKKTYYPMMYDLKLNVAIFSKDTTDIDFNQVIYELQQTAKNSDYNKPADIQLPKEAQEAEEIE